MKKEDTQLLKGVAILLMLFYHLFDHLDVVDQLHNFIFINGEPLCYILRKATHPVAFFLILGGYGLYKVYERGDRHRYVRVFKLYIHYWISLLIFVTIGCVLEPKIYPGSLSTIFYNVTGLLTTYNMVMWFLLPYTILSLIAPYVFRTLKDFRPWKIIITTLFVYIVTSYCISRYGEGYLFGNPWIYTPFLVIHLLFYFCLGALAARCDYFEKLIDKVKDVHCRKIIAGGGIIALVTINCIVKYNFFYAILMISCIYLLSINGILRRILINLGNHSMNMWMIHAWFCYYFFKDLTYSFKYPIVIFAVLTIISYCISKFVNLIAKPIELKLLNRTNIREKPII